ncbi:unnamed protein product [Sphagnum jensenii]
MDGGGAGITGDGASVTRDGVCVTEDGACIIVLITGNGLCNIADGACITGDGVCMPDPELGSMRSNEAGATARSMSSWGHVEHGPAFIKYATGKSPISVNFIPIQA